VRPFHVTPLFGLTALGWWVQPCPQCSVSDGRLKNAACYSGPAAVILASAPSRGPACRKGVLPRGVPPGRTDPPPSAQAKHAPSHCEPRSRATARRAAHRSRARSGPRRSAAVTLPHYVEFTARSGSRGRALVARSTILATAFSRASFAPLHAGAKHRLGTPSRVGRREGPKCNVFV
jgi:hypothetical protein